MRKQHDLKEPVLPDDYPISAGYRYVADGKVIRSEVDVATAAELKAKNGYTVLRWCDIIGRGLF